jgi:hypothetical protein
MSVTGDIDQAGGTLEVPGARITVAPGTVSQTTTFGITRLTDSPVAAAPGFDILGEVYELTPHAQMFGTPVNVHLALTASTDPEQIVLLTAEPGEDWQVVSGISISEDGVEASLDHFSYLAIGHNSVGTAYVITCGACPDHTAVNALLCRAECGSCGGRVTNANLCLSTCAQYITVCGHVCPNGYEPTTTMLGRPLLTSDTCNYNCGGLGCPIHPFGPLDYQYMNAKLCTIKSGVPYSAVCYQDFPVAGNINIAGHWSTTWTAGTCRGTSSLSAFQKDLTSTGRGAVAGSCILATAGPVTGVVRGSQATLTLKDPRGANYSVTFQGTVKGDTMTGTFQSALGNGTFQSTRGR